MAERIADSKDALVEEMLEARWQKAYEVSYPGHEGDKKKVRLMNNFWSSFHVEGVCNSRTVTPGLDVYDPNKSRYFDTHDRDGPERAQRYFFPGGNVDVFSGKYILHSPAQFYEEIDQTARELGVDLEELSRRTRALQKEQSRTSDNFRKRGLQEEDRQALFKAEEEWEDYYAKTFWPIFKELIKKRIYSLRFEHIVKK